MKKIITKEMIEEIFNTCNHQTDAAIALYKLAFPEWDNIQSIDGWPTAGKELNEEIFKQFGEFDKKYHPDVMPAGLWLNKGFSTLDKSIVGWELSTHSCTVTYQT
jgi:hypothetical protein